MIPTIIKSLNPNAKIMLTNALYFKSNWQDKFEPSQPTTGIFNTLSGTVKADMMHVRDLLAYAESYGAKMVAKAFADSRSYMYFVLPPEGKDIMDYVSNLTYNDFDNLWVHEVTFALPKFKSSAEISLNPIFESMGVDTSVMDIAPTGLTGEK